MIASIKRQLSLYFSNKASVFFSLMGAWIAFALYIVFLQKNMLDAWSSVQHPAVILDQWVMSGTLAVTGVTTTWTGISRLIRDKENQKFDDFLLTGMSPLRLHVTYLISASLIGVAMQLIMYGIMAGYFYWQDQLVISLSRYPFLLGLMILSSFLASLLALISSCFIKTVEVAERLALIVGTASGFLVGVYMPIGALPDFAQTVVKLTPAAYVAAAFRQILIKESLTDWNLAGMDAKEYLGIGLKWESMLSLHQTIVLLLTLVASSLFVLFVLLLQKKPKKGMMVDI